MPDAAATPDDMTSAMRSGRIAGKVALITGSTRGLGEAMGRRFAAEGAAVVITGRDVGRAQTVADELSAGGADALGVGLDVRSEESVARVVDAAVGRFGRLDILVNSAAATDAIASGGDGPCHTLAASDFDEVVKVGLYGAFYATKHAVRAMQSAGAGAIVNISSLAGVAAVPHLFAYTCTKGALVAMTRQVALQYGRARIRCNSVTVGMIEAGPVQTALFDHPILGPAFDAMNLVPGRGGPADVVAAVLYHASDEARFVTGANLVVDGGASVATRAPDPQIVFGGVSA